MNNQFLCDILLLMSDVASNEHVVVKPDQLQKPDDWRLLTKVVDKETGRPKLMFHGTTTENFIGFRKPEKDIGIHFGDYDTALARVSRFYDLRKTRHIISVYLDIRNPIRLPDLGNWFPDNIIFEIRKIDPSIFPEGFRFKYEDDLRQYEEMRQILKNRGYDGVVYINSAEVFGQLEYVREFSKVSAEMEKEIQKDPENPAYYIPVRNHFNDLLWEIEQKRKKSSSNLKIQSDSYAVFYPEQIHFQSAETLGPILEEPFGGPTGN